MHFDNTSSTLIARQTILRETLGEALYDKVVRFFTWLFQAKITPEPQNPTEIEKRYIIITRKGFSLWHAVYLCGLCGDCHVDKNQVISDRYWVKMTDEEQAEYVRGKHLFIVDDSGTTGYKAIEIQNRVAGHARITVAMLSTLYGFDETPFKDFYTFDYVTIDTRREQNMKIMAALYKLVIPFTAESHIKHTMHFSRAELDKWKKMDGTAACNHWRHEPVSLQFGAAGIIDNTFLLHAPPLEDKPANILFRGIRVCYRFLSEKEDPSQEYAEVTIIPAVVFDILDYVKTEAFLRGLLREDTWLNRQLACAGEKRRRMLVHRVVSYLFCMPVCADFFDSIAKNWPADEQNGQMETFHTHPVLLEDMRHLSEHVCQQNRQDGYPFAELSIDSETHEHLSSRLFTITVDDSEILIPTPSQSIDLLAEDLCSDREKGLDTETLQYKKDNVRKEFPLICYKGAHRGVKAMDLVRRSVASFSSVLVTIDGVSYMLKTLVPGEGSIMALIKHYSFIWGLYHICNNKRYKNDTIQGFKGFWNLQKRLIPVTDGAAVICDRLTPFYWPAKREILNSLPDDTLAAAEKYAEEFLSQCNERHT